jgi:hypothetical protein
LPSNEKEKEKLLPLVESSVQCARSTGTAAVKPCTVADFLARSEIWGKPGVTVGMVGAKRERQLTRTDRHTRTSGSVHSDDLYEESTGGGGGVPRSTTTRAREILSGRLLPRSHLLFPLLRSDRFFAERCVSWLHKFLGGFLCKFTYFFLFWLRGKFGGLVWGSIGGKLRSLCG